MSVALRFSASIIFFIVGYGSSHQIPAPLPNAYAKKVVVREQLGTSQFVRFVKPIYPTKAKRKKIQGVVRLRATITKTGDVADIVVVSDDPLLVASALTAVSQWRYVPCLLNSKPVEVKTVILLPFNLNQ